MNQKTIKVLLSAEGEEKDTLSFFVSEDHPLIVNLNTPNCQDDLQSVFAAILKESISNDIELALEIDEKYDRILYKDVCTEYIKQLNNELKKTLEKVRQTLAAD
jgi:hypothetical protein